MNRRLPVVFETLMIIVCTATLTMLSAFSCSAQNRYVLSATFTPRFNSYPNSLPVGITVDQSGNIYVAAQRAEADQFTLQGQSVAHFGLQAPSTGGHDPSNGTIDCPHSVAVDSAGNVYVTDSCNPVVQKYSAKGDFLGTLNVSAAGAPPTLQGIAIDSSGKFYVTDAANGCVHVFNPTGVAAMTFGSRGAGNGQCLEIDCIAIDQDTVYVTDDGNCRVVVFKTDGTFVRQFGKIGSGPGQFSDIGGIAVDGNHNVYVGDTARVEKFDKFGNYVTSITNPVLLDKSSNGSDPGHNSIGALAVDSSGDIYMADSYNDRIDVFKPAP